jgi:hypothetical protein
MDTRMHASPSAFDDATSRRPWLGSPWLTLPAPLLAALFAVTLWLLLSPADVMVVMREGGPIEGLTEKMYFLLAAALWLSPRRAGEWRDTLALTVMLAAAGAREMDLHKAFTGYSVLKVSFYLHDVPLRHKLTALFFLGLIAAAAFYLLRRHAGALWQRLRQREPVACSLAIFFATLVITKVLDRAINVLAGDFGVSTSTEIHALVSALEETVEMSLPVIAALARWQYLKLRPAS